MNELFEMAMNTLILSESGKAISKIYGRHNYVIRMEMVDKIAYVGGKGAIKNNGLMGEYIQYMVKHGTCWAEYTYKKDFLQAIQGLENNGFEIIWK